MWQKTKPYVISIIIALSVGALSSFLTRNSMNIYEQINTPPLSPPSILFPIVWTALFILMGISSAIVYLKKQQYPREVESAISVYIMNLAFNFAWSIIFFNLRMFLASFILLIALWIIILKMILSFRKASPVAAFLQIPYLIWVTFAGYLNIAIYILNR